MEVCIFYVGLIVEYFRYFICEMVVVYLKVLYFRINVKFWWDGVGEIVVVNVDIF